MSSNKPKKAPKGDYAVGYARPPKANQFQPGQSGNLGGRRAAGRRSTSCCWRKRHGWSNSRPATRSFTWIAIAR